MGPLHSLRARIHQYASLVISRKQRENLSLALSGTRRLAASRDGCHLVVSALRCTSAAGPRATTHDSSHPRARRVFSGHSQRCRSSRGLPWEERRRIDCLHIHGGGVDARLGSGGDRLSLGSEVGVPCELDIEDVGKSSGEAGHRGIGWEGCGKQE